MKRVMDSRTGLEVIDPDECRRLLAADEIGRLAILDGTTPAVFPVNYVLDGEAIVFRTAPGTKLSEGPRARVAFEIDHFDRAERTGWSVVVAGRLEEVTHYDAATFERVSDLPVEPWAGGEKAHLMLIRPDRISGRRITKG
jgi:hypothetical protein